jgi:hypothetical protein
MPLAHIPVPDLCDRLRTSTPLPGMDWPASMRAIVRELCRRAGEDDAEWGDDSAAR